MTKDGKPLVAFGLTGGDMQPQGHAQIIVNPLDLDMNLQEAGDAIRRRPIGSSEPTGTVMTDGSVLHIEDGLPLDVLAELKRRGHVLEPEPVGAYGGHQAIWRDPVPGLCSGATERRKDGCAQRYGRGSRSRWTAVPRVEHRGSDRLLPHDGHLAAAG